MSQVGSYDREPRCILTRNGKHLRREVDPDNLDPTCSEVLAHLSRSTSDVQYPSASVGVLRDAIEKTTVEVKPSQVITEGRRIIYRDRIVGSPNGPRIETTY